MDGLEPLGRSLVILGVVLAAIGAVLLLGPRVPLLGRLPGDIRIERDGLTIYLPIATMLIVSVVLSVLLSLLSRR
ncbi:MAG TPA: DUF2905 domain-containing protein [Candidatus Limnocylindrales bacterium]